MKYYIIAGEASGDRHAANLMKELKHLDKNASFRCWGGDAMQAQGASLVKHYRELAFMGFVEVLLNLGAIVKNLRYCKKDVKQYRPDVLILVDYPGFNLRIAPYARSLGIRVIYYISPQVWAWKPSRVYKIKRSVNRMICVLPFEKEFYARYDFDADFVGHPLLDVIDEESSLRSEAICKKQNGEKQPLIALVPGSRKQEILRMLPLMVSVCRELKDCRFVLATVSSVPKDIYTNILGDFSCELLSDGMSVICKEASVAMITSGTASLEAVLYGLPHVVCYRGNVLSYLIAKALVKIRYITIANIVLDRPVIKELIQNDLNKGTLGRELKRLLENKDAREEMRSDFAEVRRRLGGGGASARAASLIWESIKSG